jgi:hypothetical protein
MALQWHEFEPIPGVKLLKWQRLMAVDQDTGRLFISASLTGDSEFIVWLCAVDDGVPCYSLNNHYYVPAGWMAETFPNTQPLFAYLTSALLAV